MTSNARAITVNLRRQTKDWLSPLNLHWAGVALLGLVNLYLVIHMIFAWQKASSGNAEALAQQQVALKTAEIAARPLQGLDVKLKDASMNADKFALERLPVSYSEVASEVGKLAKKNNVRLTRVQYAQSPVDDEAAGLLTQVQMDSALSGDYRALVTFINGLERDRVFFLISALALTGQQTGQVNLRIRITTYLRGSASVKEMMKYQIGAPEETAEKPVAGGTR